MAAYKRIVLKLSGETLTQSLTFEAIDHKDPDVKAEDVSLTINNGDSFVLNTDDKLKLTNGSSFTLKKKTQLSKGAFEASRVEMTARVIGALHDLGVQVGIVLGGGNIWRGRFSDSMDPVSADQMGMLATIINALAVQEALVRFGYKATVLTAQEMTRFAPLYTRDAADKLLNDGHIVLMAGGSGNPFFTTDTAAALRAAELKADALFKGTTVKGVYTADPKEDDKKKPEDRAKFVPDCTYDDAIKGGWKVMDLTAFLLCKEREVPVIRVFNMDNLYNIIEVAQGANLGSTVHP